MTRNHAQFKTWTPFDDRRFGSSSCWSHLFFGCPALIYSHSHMVISQDWGTPKPGVSPIKTTHFDHLGSTMLRCKEVRCRRRWGCDRNELIRPVIHPEPRQAVANVTFLPGISCDLTIMCFILFYPLENQHNIISWKWWFIVNLCMICVDLPIVYVDL